eukprot:6595625-Heterocapsa_arctica.AAC.1
MEELANDTGMKITHHRWCNFGITDEVTGRPSSIVTKVMSSRPLQAQGDCSCGHAPDHHGGRASGQMLFDMRL